MLFAAKTSKDVRKSNLLFGTDRTEQSDHKNKSLVASPGSKSSMTNINNGMSFKKIQPIDLVASKTNIQINHYGGAAAASNNRFTSTYRSSNSLQIQPVNITQRISNNAFSRKQTADNTSSKNAFHNVKSKTALI